MKSADKCSVLVVDDDKANIMVLTKILSPEYTIYVTRNGKDAFEMAKTNLPDVILLDILMPEMDGYEVLSLLKKTKETQSIPVIFITGLTESENEEKGMALGASDYITKPFSAEIVKLRVRNQMKILEQIRTINQRLRQQSLMASISQSFLSTVDVNAMFTNTLRLVGEFMGITQILLHHFEEDGITLTCRNEWTNSAFDMPTRIGKQYVLKDPILSVIRGLRIGETNLCMHSNDPVFKSVMRPYREDFDNYITVPVFTRGKLCAVVDFSRDGDGWEWSESDINLTLLVASILSGVYELSAMGRQSSIVEHSPQFIMYLSPGADVSYVNPAASALTGHTKTAIMAGGLGLIFDAETAREIKKTHIPNTLRKGDDSFEVNMRRKDGEIRTLAFSSFTAENGNIGAIAQDVTDMRALEAALVKAKDLAEQSSRAKSDFLARMSHEMHTPMNAIIGMTHIAKTSGSPEKKKECLKEIDSSSRHLLRLIDDVLDYSSLEESKLTLNNSQFLFNSMVSDVLKSVRFYTEEKHQTLTCVIDPLMPGVLIGDEKRLAQVFRNLLMNASKFSPDGGRIQLDASVFGDENGAVVFKIEVSDNGIGIPKDKQSSIFNSFEQVEECLSREYDGAGLGLAISKKIVEMMGGRIWVESEPGKGAKFIFTFKAKNIHNKESEKDSAEKQNKTFDGKTVLLVEDVDINREIMMAMLEETRLEVDYAANGEQAIEKFEANPGRYDLILMDISMPVMDGWEASRRIRALEDPEKPRIIIIALTAHTLREDMKKSLDAGMDDHLGKPINFDELLFKLNKYLGE